MNLKGKSLLCILLLILSSCPAISDAAPVTVTLAGAGRAMLPIVVGLQATADVYNTAVTLASYLERITGAAFEVRRGDGLSGIAVGRAADFPNLPFNPAFGGSAAEREHYLIRTHPKGIYLLGAGEWAVEHAVWDLLYRLGYRHFFPGNRWEIIPRDPSPIVCLDLLEKPDFLTRVIRGYHPDWKLWLAHNRAAGGLEINSNHQYQRIISQNKDAFNEHPEYYALVNGKRENRGQSTKLCNSNPALRKMVAGWAVRYFADNPEADSLSMEPSDGGGWCQCPLCLASGSISNRAVLLANEVVDAVRKVYPDKYIGLLAYNQHAASPTIKVHPGVVVRVTTHQRVGSETLEELLDAWRKEGALTGVSDAYGTAIWDMFLPGQAPASNIDYLRQSITEAYKHEALFAGGWASDCQAQVGLGHYIAARLLWDVAEAENVDRLFDDFLERAFGPAREPMERYFRLIYRLDGKERSTLTGWKTAGLPTVDEDLIGRMYGCLKEARQRSHDPDIRARLDELVIYTRYVELFESYSRAAGAARRAALGEFMRFYYRAANVAGIISLSDLWSRLADREKGLLISSAAAGDAPVGKNPWKGDRPFCESEIARILDEGIADNIPAAVQTANYSLDLVPADALRLAPVEQGSASSFHAFNSFYTWVPEGCGQVALKVTGSMEGVGHNRIKLYAVNGAKIEEVAHDDSLSPDGRSHDLILRTPRSGLHLVESCDGRGRTSVLIRDEGRPMVFDAGPDARVTPWFRESCNLYFYVPKGKKTVDGYGPTAGGSRAAILDGAGRVAYSFNGRRRSGYFSIPVPEGQDGRLWKIAGMDWSGKLIRLFNVPPYLARSGRELLLPAEVVKADEETCQ